MTLTLVNGASSYAVSLAEAKEHLRVEHDDDDALISALIAAAFAFAEKRTGRAFSTQTWKLTLDAFPDDEIAIPVGPLASVVSVAYVDADGETQTLAEADYRADLVSATGRISPAAAWPVASEVYGAVIVTFTLGGSTPADVRHAVLLLIGLWYENREAGSPDQAHAIPMGAEALLSLHHNYYV